MCIIIQTKSFLWYK
uniref:Uncharacterized protein n=1 Tax=Rhizophora mucronata TaxID=61149 RepID=A0A2P2J7J6_RHIMU